MRIRESMKIGAYNPANDSSTKPWFISSVVVTVVLIIVLGGNLVFSFNVLDSFRNEELGAERSSWKLLLYAEQMHMATRASALSGNLKWKETYDTARPKLETVLTEVPNYVPSPEIREKAEKLQIIYRNISEIEASVYELVSRGDKDEALTLLSGWSYTQNRLAFERTTREIFDTIQQRIIQRTTAQKRLALFFWCSCLWRPCTLSSLGPSPFDCGEIRSEASSRLKRTFAAVKKNTEHSVIHLRTRSPLSTTVDTLSLRTRQWPRNWKRPPRRWKGNRSTR